MKIEEYEEYEEYEVWPWESESSLLLVMNDWSSAKVFLPVLMPHN